jgi:hypothetical protein
LCDFVIGRFGQNKPITIKSLEGNLGLSESTIKRRINNSFNLTRKKNYCFMDNKFDNVCEAHNHLRKTRIMFPNDSSAYRIIKRDGKFLIAKQLGNSYSVEDFSRGKISKRPSSFRKIDFDNKESLSGKKFFYTKIKKANDNNFVLSKIKSDNSEFFVWKLINPEQESLNEINENLENSHRVKVWNSEKKWSRRKKEC